MLVCDVVLSRLKRVVGGETRPAQVHRQEHEQQHGKGREHHRKRDPEIFVGKARADLPSGVRVADGTRGSDQR